jgi:hypothetical protein
LKNVIDQNDILEALNSEKRKMQMSVEKKLHYRKQIKYYLIKMWSPITNESAQRNSIVPEKKKKGPEQLVPQFMFDDVCSVGSMAAVQNPTSQIINDNQNYTKTVSDEKSSFMQSESISDATITAFERIIYFLVIPFFGLVITDYIMFSIEVEFS